MTEDTRPGTAGESAEALAALTCPGGTVYGPGTVVVVHTGGCCSRWSDDAADLTPPATWYEGPRIAAAALRAWAGRLSRLPEGTIPPGDLASLTSDLRGAAAVLDQRDPGRPWSMDTKVSPPLPRRAGEPPPRRAGELLDGLDGLGEHGGDSL